MLGKEIDYLLPISRQRRRHVRRQSNLQGKTLIPFATSGGSDIQKSIDYLSMTYPMLKWEKEC